MVTPFSSMPWKSRPDCRAAFSLVELLAVIAIIGALIAVLLPAVEAARESARKVRCVNNLKHLSLAVAKFESTHKAYPAGGLTAKGLGNIRFGTFDPRGGKMFSWVVQVLPQIEEETLYRQFDLRRNVLDQPREPQATPLATMVCPSDDAQGRFFVDPILTTGKQFAKGNYAAYVSPYHIDHCDWWPSGLAGNRVYRPKNIRDGLSKTLLLSEVRTMAAEGDQRGAWALPWAGASLLAFDFHSYGSGLATFRPVMASIGHTQLPNTLGPNADVLYGCPDAATARLEDMPCAEYKVATYLSAAPRSRHFSGVNVAFCDGHVAFIADEVDELTMAYLISSDDGQTVDLP